MAKTTLSRNLRFIRESQAMTQTEFGAQFNCSRGMIDSYESGKAKPDLDTITAISNRYKLPVEVLTTIELEENPPLLTQAHNDPLKEENETLKNRVGELEREVERQRKIIDKLTS